MKTIKNIASFLASMVIISLFVFPFCFLESCVDDSIDKSKQEKEVDIDQIAVNKFNSLKPPIILLAKDKTMGCWGVVLIDSTKKVITIGDLTTLGNRLGASYKVGDTIVR